MQVTETGQDAQSIWFVKYKEWSYINVDISVTVWTHNECLPPHAEPNQRPAFSINYFVILFNFARFHIHLYNIDDLLRCILPYHESKMFIRVIQILTLKDETNKWHWLYPLQVRCWNCGGGERGGREGEGKGGLQYHESKMFIRVIQILTLKEEMNKWHWLHPLQVRCSNCWVGGGKGGRGGKGGLIHYHESKMFIPVIQILTLKEESNKWHWLYPLQVRCSNCWGGRGGERERGKGGLQYHESKMFIRVIEILTLKEETKKSHWLYPLQVRCSNLLK